MDDTPHPGRIEFGPPPTAEVLRFRQALREIRAICGDKAKYEPVATIRRIAQEALR